MTTTRTTTSTSSIPGSVSVALVNTNRQLVRRGVGTEGLGGQMTPGNLSFWPPEFLERNTFWFTLHRSVDSQQNH